MATKLYRYWMHIGLMQRIFLALLMASICSLVFIQVIMRYVLHIPLMGIEELLIIPTIWLYLYGGVQASWERTHIACGIMTLYIKKPLTKFIFNMVKYIVSLAVMFWLAKWALWFFLYSLRVGRSSSSLGIPLFIGEVVMSLSLIFMFIYAAIDLIQDVRMFINNGTDAHSNKEQIDKESEVDA